MILAWRGNIPIGRCGYLCPQFELVHDKGKTKQAFQGIASGVVAAPVVRNEEGQILANKTVKRSTWNIPAIHLPTVQYSATGLGRKKM